MANYGYLREFVDMLVVAQERVSTTRSYFFLHFAVTTNPLLVLAMNTFSTLFWIQILDI